MSTARAVLRVMSLLAREPAGVRADDVAEALGKSVSTAYNLLASLCDEGVAARHPGGRYRLAESFRDLVASGALAPVELPALGGIVDDLLARTHKRSYLGVVQGGHLCVLLERGVQGMPRVPGLDGDIDGAAHALALGKVALAAASRPALQAYVARGLRRFTPHTITDPAALLRQLRDVRRSGLAVDMEEFRPDLCCLAAPVFDSGHHFLGAVGIAMTRRALEDGREPLSETLRDVARTAGAGSAPRFQPSADPPLVLAPGAIPALASTPQSSVR